MNPLHQRRPSVEKIAYVLPAQTVTNEDLAPQTPWSADAILAKTGIARRCVAAEEETASDLAFRAAEALLAEGERSDIDLLVFCSQSPDYDLPTTACVLQDRLGLPKSCAAFDINLGCSGYVYGLAAASSLISTGLATKGLLLTGETYSRYFEPTDHQVSPIFGDAGTATLILSNKMENDRGESETVIGPFRFGTDGSDYYFAYLLGRSYIGMRTDDLLITARYLKNNYQLPIRLAAEGYANTIALHAAIVEPELFSAVDIDKDALKNWNQLVEQSPCYIQLTDTIHGVLNYYDTDILLNFVNNRKK